jgi:Fe-S cluster assembly iron-binding protein IscA
MFEITERAKSKLKEMLADKEGRGYFRIFIAGFG